MKKVNANSNSEHKRCSLFIYAGQINFVNSQYSSENYELGTEKILEDFEELKRSKTFRLLNVYPIGVRRLRIPVESETINVPIILGKRLIFFQTSKYILHLI